MRAWSEITTNRSDAFPLFLFLVEPMPQDVLFMQYFTVIYNKYFYGKKITILPTSHNTMRSLGVLESENLAND